ncbi:MAG TPA: FHA domain-containing protein [Polyangia bacterium]|jgi:hypothetical protein
MPRFRLRFHTTEIDLPLGDVIIGRALECFIRLDDAMVSRRHARLFVTDDGITVEDLGSRNGVTVNAAVISGRVRLTPNDVIGIGHEEFTLLTQEARRTLAGVTGRIEVNLCPGCGEAVPHGISRCPACGRHVPSARAQTVGDAHSAALVEDGAAAVLNAIGDKALAMGRVDEAERILGGSLRDIQARIARGHRPDAAHLEPAMQRALRLAGETRKDEWFRWIFEVAGAAGMVLPSGIIDELHMLMFQHKPAAGAAVDAYLTAVTAPAADAEQVFQLKRVGALRRFCRD